jgi:hypothetical protein
MVFIAQKVLRQVAGRTFAGRATCGCRVCRRVRWNRMKCRASFSKAVLSQFYCM